MIYQKKLVISGKYVEIYEYQKPLKREFTRKERKPPDPEQLNLSDLLAESETHEGKQLGKRKDSIARTRSQLRRLINANDVFTKFVTLTFAKNTPDVDSAHYEFKKFILRLKYNFPNLKYIAVIEFQKDEDFNGFIKPLGGSVHYHFLCDIPYLKNSVLQKLWGCGFVKINKIKNVTNVGAYVCKYLQKDMQEKRLFNKKKFFYSENLARSVSIFDPEIIESIICQYGLKSAQPVYKSKFDNEFIGVVEYNQFKLT